MEKLYKKVGKRYVEVGYDTPDLTDGIWLVQRMPYGKSTRSLVWRVGELKQPVDVVTYAALMSFEDVLAQYLVKLGDENSEEYKSAKEQYSGWLYGPVEYGNISASDLTSLFLRKIGEQLESGVYTDWAKLMFDFRGDVECSSSDVKILYAFTEWLEKNGYELKQNK